MPGRWKECLENRALEKARAMADNGKHAPGRGEAEGDYVADGLIDTSLTRA